MSPSHAPIELRFEPPGPGCWEQDPVHFPRPMTRYFQETQAPAGKRGTNDFARFYGMLIDGIQVGYVNGFGYNQVLPTPEEEVPARLQRAEQVFAQKLWREQLRDWDEHRKPAAIATHRDRPRVLRSVQIVTPIRRSAASPAPMSGITRVSVCGGAARILPRAAHFLGLSGLFAARFFASSPALSTAVFCSAVRMPPSFLSNAAASASW